MLKRTVLRRLSRGKCKQEKRGCGPNKARDESHDDGRPPPRSNGRTGTERTGQGQATEEETPASGSLLMSGRTGRRCSTCTTHVRSRFRTTHRKAPLPTPTGPQRRCPQRTTPMFNDVDALRTRVCIGPPSPVSGYQKLARASRIFPGCVVAL